ncbi:MAG: hypothetical protein R3F49_18830 [Planctomycetota bacterium]
MKALDRTPSTTCFLFALALASGCREVATTGDVTTIAWSSWVRASVLIVCAACVVGTLVAARRAHRAAGWRGPAGLTTLGLAVASCFASLVAYVVVADRLYLTPDEVYDHRGFPWAREKRGFRLDEVARVTLRDVLERRSRTSVRETYWDLHFRDGHMETLDPGDLWDASTAEIQAHLEAAGVRFGGDPTHLGLPSDDPFVVTIVGTEYHLDSADPRESAAAFFLGGHMAEMTSPEHELPLSATLRRGEGPAGTWSVTVRDGARAVTLECALDDAGGLRQTLVRGAARHVSTGTYRVGERELTLEVDGATSSLMFRTD